MDQEEKKFFLYLTVLRFLPFKVTNNLRKIFLDFDMQHKRMLLSAVYETHPSEKERELFDDIVTDSNAHVSDFFIESNFVVVDENVKDRRVHDFIVFAFYEGDD
ncbi:MAG: hypothetical protein ABW007_02385 [Chitinophagaceae bacterium]